MKHKKKNRRVTASTFTVLLNEDEMVHNQLLKKMPFFKVMHGFVFLFDSLFKK